jgi:hypothetical protein
MTIAAVHRIRFRDPYEILPYAHVLLRARHKIDVPINLILCYSLHTPRNEIQYFSRYNSRENVKI